MAAMLCEECKSIAADVDDENGLFSQNFYWKLKDTLEALKQSSETCECCFFITHHLPKPYPASHYRDGDIPKDGEVILRRGDSRYELSHEHIGVWAGNLLGELSFQISTRWDDPAAEHESIACRNIGSNSGGPDCVDFVRRQIQECEDYHKDCPGPIIPALPTRILDLGTDSTDIKIVHSQGLNGKYVALSHCWGSPNHPPTKTLSTNIEERMRRIEFGDLSTVFQEAVAVTRSLGIQYIWIDALCIIQDSKEDWREQAAKMSSVYTNATITIGSSCASNSHDSFFRQRKMDYSPALPFWSSKTGIKGNIYLRPTQGHPTNIWNHPHGSQPLQKRAWTYQERLLSSRMIFYDSKDLVWECGSGVLFEDYDRLLDSASFGVPFRKLNTVFRDHRRGYREYIIEPYSKRNPRIQREPNENASAYVHWYKILEEFGKRELTFRDDVLPALSGVAAAFASLAEFTYLGGVWKEDFPGCLSWEIKPKSAEDSELTGTVSQRSALAPTWSWACLIGRRNFKTPFILERARRLQSEHEAVLLKWTVQPLGDDPLGQLKYCDLWVRGWCRPVHVNADTIHSAWDISATFKEDEGLEILTTLDEPDVDIGTVSPQPPLLCLALGEWSLARHFVVPTLLCLIIKATGKNDDEYTRVGTVKIGTPLDPIKAVLPPQAHHNIRKESFEGLWGNWNQQTVVLI